ncbi:MAG: response regulator [Saprospiraceae bacterium]
MKKILVIEDNTIVRENLAEVLELSNYEVITAENGKVGVEKALTESPDLILCDVMMPVLDGFGVLKILDKKPATADIPLIFLTAKAEKMDFRKGMNLGADDYITKPYDDVELLEAVEMRLKKSDRIKKSFDGTQNGLRTFIDEARGQKELEKLSQERDNRNFRKKDFLYQEGDHPQRLYFLASGQIKTYRSNDAGKEFITHIYKSGDFLGYYALLRDEPYKETAMVIEDAEIHFIPKEDFFSLLYNNRNFSARFIKMLANNTNEQEEQLLSLAYSSIRKRVAETLVKLDQQNEEEGKEQIVILRDDLAGMVGTAKESVIRTLTDFKHEGLVDIKQGVITVLNRQKLADLRN